MMHPLFSVNIITGLISEIDSALANDIVNSPTLCSATTDGLDHADPKDRRVPINRVSKIIDEMTKALKESGEDVIYDSHWGHVHQKNMSTNTHSHLPSKWSAACYLQVPENSGKICFMVEELNMQASISPKVGGYIIFPSELKHYVTAHGNDEPRVSLSVNWK